MADETTNTTGLDWALDKWTFMLSNPSDNPQFLEEAKNTYNASNDVSWEARLTNLQERIDSSNGHTRRNLQNELNRADADLLEWARENYLPTHEGFLESAQADYDTIHGVGAWDKYVQDTQIELAENAEGWNGRDFNPLTWVGAMDSDADISAAFNQNEALANWGYIHMASQQSALDFSGAEAFGLDPDIFKSLDAQTQVADETIADRSTEIGKAYLNAAEILYNEKEGAGAWAKYVAEEGLDPDTADTELAAYGESQVGWMLEDNITTAGVNYFAASDEAKISVLYLQQLQAYREGSWGDLGNSILRGSVDPTMWVGLGSGGTLLSARVTAQIAMRNSGKYILANTLKSRLAGVTIGAMTGGALEGAITEGALVYAQQQTGIDVGVRQDYDFKSIMLSAGMGGVFGAVLGGGMGVAGHALARRMDFATIARTLKGADVGEPSASYNRFIELAENAEAAAAPLRGEGEATPAQMQAFKEATEALFTFDATDVSTRELAYLRSTNDNILRELGDLAEELGIDTAPSAATRVDAPESPSAAAAVDTVAASTVVDTAPASRTAPELDAAVAGDAPASQRADDTTTIIRPAPPSGLEAAIGRVSARLRSFAADEDGAVSVPEFRRLTGRAKTSKTVLEGLDEKISTARDAMDTDLSETPDTSAAIARIDQFLTVELDAIKTQANADVGPRGLHKRDAKALDDELASIRAERQTLVSNAINTRIDAQISALQQQLKVDLITLRDPAAITARINRHLNTDIPNIRTQAINNAAPDGLLPGHLTAIDGKINTLTTAARRDSMLEDALSVNVRMQRLYNNIMNIGPKLNQAMDRLGYLGSAFRFVNILSPDDIAIQVNKMKDGLTRMTPYLWKNPIARKSRTIKHFVDHMSESSKTMLDTIKNADPATFDTTRDQAVADYRAMADQLETALSRFGTTGGPKLTLETDIPLRGISYEMGFNISGMQKKAVESFIKDMRSFANDMEAKTSPADFQEYLSDSAQRISGKGQIWEGQDYLIASTFDEGGYKKEGDRILPGRTNLAQIERLKRAMSQAYHPEARRTLAPSGNRENYGYRNIETLIESLDPNSATYFDDATQVLWEIYERGLEVDALAHLEFAINKLGDDPKPGVVQSDPVQRFDEILPRLEDKIIRQQTEKLTATDASGNTIIVDEHFKSFIRRLADEEKSVWRPNPQGTKATWFEWLIGRNLDGRGHTRRENRKRWAFSALPKMIYTQYKESFDATGTAKPTDAGRSYFKDNVLPRNAQFVWNYIIGRDMDYDSSYNGEAGLYADPRGFRWDYLKAPKEDDVPTPWKPWTYLTKPGTYGRQFVNILYRGSGMGLVDMALFYTPKTAFKGLGVYANASRVRLAARSAYLVALGSAVEAYASEDGWTQYHPATVVDDPIATTTQVVYGTFANANGLVLPLLLPDTQAGFFNDQNGYIPYGSGLRLASEFTGIGVGPKLRNSETGSSNSAKNTDGNTETATLDPSDPRTNILMRWVEGNVAVPNGWVPFNGSNAKNVYIEQIVATGAQLWKEEYPGLSVAESTEPAAAATMLSIWKQARAAVDLEDIQSVDVSRREAAIRVALTDAYKTTYSLGENGNPRATEGLNYDDVVAWLIEDTTGSHAIAPLPEYADDAAWLNPTLPYDGWPSDAEQAALTERMKYYETVGVNQLDDRTQAITASLTAYIQAKYPNADVNNLPENLQTTLDGVVAQLVNERPNGSFHTPDALKDDTTKAMREGRFDSTLTKVDKEILERTTAATRFAASKEGLVAWLNDLKGIDNPINEDKKVLINYLNTLSDTDRNAVIDVIAQETRTNGRLTNDPTSPFLTIEQLEGQGARVNAIRRHLAANVIKTQEITDEQKAALLAEKPEKIETPDEEPAEGSTKDYVSDAPDHSIDWRGTREAAVDGINYVFDHDNDGASIFVDTAGGRAVSGFAQNTVGAMWQGLKNNDGSRGGKQLNNFLMAAGGALFMPMALSMLPGFKWANSRFARPLIMIGTLFMAWKLLNGGDLVASRAIDPLATPLKPRGEGTPETAPGGAPEDTPKNDGQPRQEGAERTPFDEASLTDEDGETGGDVVGQQGGESSGGFGTTAVLRDTGTVIRPDGSLQYLDAVDRGEMSEEEAILLGERALEMDTQIASQSANGGGFGAPSLIAGVSVTNGNGVKHVAANLHNAVANKNNIPAIQTAHVEISSHEAPNMEIKTTEFSVGNETVALPFDAAIVANSSHTQSMEMART